MLVIAHVCVGKESSLVIQCRVQGEYDHYYIFFFLTLQGEYFVNVAPAYWPHEHNFLHLCASSAFAKMASSGGQLPYFLNIEMLT